MDARKMIQDIPTETLVTMVGLLTNGRADPQFVRAAAMAIKKSNATPLHTPKTILDTGCHP